jgi:ABC-2 type transport system ATP-binding protein
MTTATVAEAVTAAASPPSTSDAADADVDAVVDVRELVKVYKGDVRAVDGVTFSVERGGFFGFLGPNGAGKTTTIRVLSTLLRPTSGSARLLGLDVVDDAAAVRRRIGFAMQQVAIENLATARENLELIGRLHRMPRAEMHARAGELLELMNLAHVGDKLAGTFSGGMRRRLDLATALMHRPEILFLDEPTEGLDPQSRSALWDELLRINGTGTTMFLTTHYMEEADRLCRRLAIIDDGKIAVEGTPGELKRSVGADTVSLTLAADGAEALEAARNAVREHLGGLDIVTAVEPTNEGVDLSVPDAHGAIPELLRRLDGVGTRVSGLSMREPSLDDVFLRYTGKRIRLEEADQPLTLGWY